MDNKKTVTLLFTRHYSLMSNFIYFISGFGYTHVSISLEDAEKNSYYSFNFKGFSNEHLSRKVKKFDHYKIEVSEDVYNKISEKISAFEENKSEYSYSRLGVFLCMLNIRHKFSKSYFCSQFVAETLHDAGAIELRRHSSLYFPNRLADECKSFNCTY